MADKKYELRGNLLNIAVVFLVGLFVFWGFRVYEIYWNTQGGNYPREITVEATGEAYVVPDTAKVYLGVYTSAETTEKVIEESTEKMSDIMTTLENLEISEEDIKTTNYNLYPNYQWTQDEGEYLDGYMLDQNVEVKLDDFDKIGKLLDEVVDAGANVIGDVSFVVDDTENAKDEARMDAIAKVKEKAGEIAGASGLKLGRVLSYYEYEPYDYDYYDYGYESASSSYAAYDVPKSLPPIAPGQKQVQLTVSLSYQVK